MSARAIVKTSQKAWAIGGGCGLGCWKSSACGSGQRDPTVQVQCLARYKDAVVRTEMSISVMRRQIKVTVIPRGPTSWAMTRVKPITAAFDAESCARSGALCLPLMEAMVRMRP